MSGDLLAELMIRCVWGTISFGFVSLVGEAAGCNSTKRCAANTLVGHDQAVTLEVSGRPCGCDD